MYVSGRIVSEEESASTMAMRGTHLPYIQGKAKRPKKLKQSEQGEKKKVRSEWWEYRARNQAFRDMKTTEE